MKNQYFGDVNDYLKYGLLRLILGVTGWRLLVAWMLTPDDGSRDGGRRRYLEQADCYRQYDPELYEFLRARLVKNREDPRVFLLEESGMLPRTTFHSCLVPDRREAREAWRACLYEAARDRDLVFFDPDNGIEVPSRPIGRKGSSKYVAWQELETIWTQGEERGTSLLVYQHFPREPRDEFVRRIRAEVRKRLGGRAFVRAFRTRHVLFLLALQEEHRARYTMICRRVRQCWEGQVWPAGSSGGRGTGRRARC